MVPRMHPGHGQTEPTTWLHYFVEPVHVAIGLAVAIAGAVVAMAVWRRRRGNVASRLGIGRPSARP